MDSDGPFSGKLSNEGENIELRNAQGALVDEVEYSIGFPWPVAADGGGGSMELINSMLDNNLGSSWRPSYDTLLFPENDDPVVETGDPLGSLAHRWSFNGNLIDSVGGAEAVLVDPQGIASLSNGRIDVSANNGEDSDQNPFTSGAYLDLPNNIISDLGDNATFEWWGSITSNRISARIFSFGVSEGGEDVANGAPSEEYLALSPRAGSGDLEVVHHDGGTGERSAASDSTFLPIGVEQHVAVVWDGQASEQRLYLNGQFIDSSATVIDLSQIEDLNNWLGRSQWSDPLFDGLHNEFRIYHRPLSDADVLASYDFGPDATSVVPVIHAFAASDEDIFIGQSAMLTWSVDDFDQLTLNAGIGDVSGLGQIVVTPRETTTYVLSASNSEGVSTRRVTIQVEAPIASPGSKNNSYTENAAPNIRQVQHATSTSAESTLVTAKVTDAQGVTAVRLYFQVVLPGQYNPARLPVPLNDLIADGNLTPTPNPEYFDPANWTAIAMSDDGAGGDAAAGDDIYSVAIPPPMHRSLVRYRIEVEDRLGAAATAPFADDPSLNFAYFVYDGLPDYRSNSGQLLADTETLSSAPVYHFLTRGQDMEEVLAYSSSDQIPQGSEARFAYNWHGTMVYDGVVYDNIRYRLRGANGRYQTEGKRSMRFRFNGGHYFQALDQHGDPYPTKWRTLTTGKGSDNRSTLTYGLNEAATLYLSNLMGLPASETHWFHFRVIDGVSEAPDQWRGDFWGLNFALETYDKRFLDAHSLESGNLYKLINQSRDAEQQQRYLWSATTASRIGLL